jgi:hypothetical protein
LKKEPELSDFIYEEFRQCEEYALMNMITFEAAIRNKRVKEIIGELKSVSNEKKLDALLEGDDTYSILKKELREKYYLEYNDYLEYMNIDKKECQFHIKHNNGESYSHILSLPLHRPKMTIPHKDSTINIKIPMYHIHPKDIKAYYKRLLEKHLEVVSDARDYYHLEELFFDETDETKSKASIYAKMFYVWDYIQWWKEKHSDFTPDMTARSVYFQIGEKIAASIQDKTGRYSIIEKYIEQMNKLINGGYKRLYHPKNREL